MRCFIDIGVQKTGSKSRQRFFLRRLGTSASKTVLYPASGRAGVWHQPLFDALQQDDDSLLLQARAEAAKARCEYVVISYEGMHALAEAGIRRIAAVFPDVLVLVFVRRQDEFINSMHNQLHKSHRRSLRDLENFERRMFERDSRCDYGEIVQRWAACAGVDRVKPVVYQRRKCSVQAFLQASGLALEAPADNEYSHNHAIDTFGMAVLRQVKAMARNFDELPVLVEQAHKDLEPYFLSEPQTRIPWTLSLNDRQRIMALYKESNEWLRARYFNETQSLFQNPGSGVCYEYDPGKGRKLAEAIVSRARNRST